MILDEELPMWNWSTEELCNWLKEVTDEKTIGTIRSHGLVGKDLINTTLTQLLQLVPKESKCICILEDRDDYIKRERETIKSCTYKKTNNDTEPSDLVEPFRKFGRPIDISDSYQQHAQFPSAPCRPTNLVEDPVRRFVSLESVANTGLEFDILVKEVIVFGAACLNECTNGVLYFGVDKGRIEGTQMKCDKMLLDKIISQQIEKKFHKSQADMVLRCIRPLRWTYVKPQGYASKSVDRYVIEVEVEPTSDLCGEDVYLVDSSRYLYKFGTGGPVVVDKGQYFKFFNEKYQLAKSRKRREDDSRRQPKQASPAQLDDLVSILCQGKSVLPEGQYPVLVLPPADEDLDSAMIEEQFFFLQYVKWKVVLDFGADRKFLNYMNKHDCLFRIRDIEDFDLEVDGTMSLKNTKEDAYNGHVPIWILMNGDRNRGREPKELRDWKKDTDDACRMCFKTYTEGFKSSRVLLVFLLHSKCSSVFVDACAQLYLQAENLACISEEKSIAETWKAALVKYPFVKKEDLSKHIVAGLPWVITGEKIKEIANKEPQSACKVPTSIGDQVLSIKSELFDLDIVGSNECSDDKLPQDSEKQEFLKSKEVKFYKGGEVDWWNFWSESVVKRDLFSQLCKKVKSALFEEGVEGEVEKGIKTVTLYHQPGSGGTTCAKHILWDFRQDVKCAEIVHCTENTCSQIGKLRDFGEIGDYDPGPLLLLIDNMDPEKTFELMTNLKRKSGTRDKNVSKPNAVYCVCLMVERRPNLPNEGMAKDEHYECLRQRLSSREQYLFGKQSEGYEKDLSDTLIAFNIMKENFDSHFIEEAVTKFIHGITSSEKLFLKYLAFLNFYDICQKTVEVAAFDDIMRGHTDPYWEEYLSDALCVLVNRKSCENGHRGLKISHPLLSGEILKVMRKEPLSEFTVDLLTHKFLQSKVSYAAVNLRRLFASIVKQRVVNKSGYREPFAPLILQIKQEESWQKAAHVLQKVYELTGDAFVAQQLARLNIDAECWGSAKEYASTAAAMIPDNYHLLDTKGQVYRHSLEKNYDSASGMEHPIVTLSDMQRMVQEAYEATKIFKGVQKLCHITYSKDQSTKPTISGQLGSLQIYASILENLSLLRVFGGKPQRRVSKMLRDFLHEKTVPDELGEWEDDNITFLQGIPEDAKETLRYVEDFHAQLNTGFIRLKDSDYEVEIARQKKAITSLKRRLYKFILKVNVASTDLMAGHPKDSIWLLGGTSFNNILDRLDLKTGILSDEGQQEEARDVSFTDGDREEMLQNLLFCAEECIRGDPHHYEAIECFLSVALIVSCYFDQTELASKILYDDVLDRSKVLFNIRNVKPNRIEPYMYYVMLHWPASQNSPERKSVSDAIKTWKEVYTEKNPNIPANQAFYLTGGKGLKSLIHRSQLYNSKKHRGDMFWRDENVRQKLKRFTGSLDGKGNLVYLQGEECEEYILTMPTSYTIQDSLLWRSTVTFVIAFTFMGPKAYDVQRK